MAHDTSPWFTKVEPFHSKSVKWDMRADIVVVGAGGAGMAAAVQALENGLSVIVVDKFNGGGTTYASGGVIYAGGGTTIQEQAGVSDSPQNMFAYLKKETGNIIKDDTLMDFCKRSPETIEWLQKHNVIFGTKLWPQKTSYPAPQYFLYHSDNSLLEDYKAIAKPAARGHRGYVPPKQGKKAMNLGGSIFDPLKASAQKMGLQFEDYAEARQLIENNNRITGIKVLAFRDPVMKQTYIRLRQKAQKFMNFLPPILPGAALLKKHGLRYLKKAEQLEVNRQSLFIKAQKGVILAAGGFVFNRNMFAHYAPKYASGFPLGTTGDDGSGIHLGMSVGGKIGNMNRASAWRFINPPLSFAKGLIVNAQGQRFINEMVYGAALGCEIAENHDATAWLILDKNLVKSALHEVKGGNVLPFQRDLARLNIWLASKKTKTLTELASKIKCDPKNLSAQIDTYNRLARGEMNDMFGKAKHDLAEIKIPPYYAINISINAKLFPCPVLTLGGLCVDETSGRVLHNATNKPIDGLYAAGRNAIGICSHNYVSGLSIADAIYSGRRAARHITKQK